MNGCKFSLSFPSDIPTDVVLEAFVSCVASALRQESADGGEIQMRDGPCKLSDLDLLDSGAKHWVRFQVGVCDSQEENNNNETKHLLFYSTKNANYSVIINNAISTAIDRLGND